MSTAAVLPASGNLPASPVLAPSVPMAEEGMVASVGRESTLIILDWDDTVLPTTYLAMCGYRADGPDPDEALATRLHAYSEHALALLGGLLNLGHVVICTNAESGWIELTCKKFLPQLESLVGTLEKISARSEFEPKGITNPFDWKKHAFSGILQRYGRLNVLSVGDSTHERSAVLHGWQHLGDPRAMCKSLKLLERPDLDCLRLQHVVALTVINHVVSYAGHLDLFVLCNPGVQSPHQPHDLQVVQTPNGFGSVPILPPHGFTFLDA
jgi:hypothetical protein